MTLSNQPTSTTTDANNQDGGGDTTPSKKHAIKQSPRKTNPPKKLKVDQAGTPNIQIVDNLDNTVANLEARVAKLEEGSQKHLGSFWKKLADQHKFLAFEINKKLDQDAAMTDEEHEEFITEFSEMATRAHFRKVLKVKVQAIVRDVIEDVIEDVLQDLVYRKLKECDAAIKGMLEAKTDQADQDELGEEFRGTRRKLEELRRQLAAIMDRIQDI